MIKTAMIGFGVIAGSHKAAHLRQEKLGRERLVAVCDLTPSQIEAKKKPDPETGELKLDGNYKVYTDLEQMLACEEIDLIDICTPSYTHEQLAIDMLERGYNVLCEKPMALTVEGCDRMLDAWKRSGRFFMIGQCLRFYGEYEYLRSIIEDGRFGRVTSVVFERLSDMPHRAWRQWYDDFSLAGGVITDMQIHDLDMVRYLFGEPSEVSCRASSKNVKFDCSHVTMSGYDFPVTCIGDWTLKGMGFSHRYRVGFEQATVEMVGGRITVYPQSGKPYAPEDYKPRGGIDGEVDYLLTLLETGEENLKNPPESAKKTIELVRALISSAEAGGAPVHFS